jgi:CBS-domain-containing membrane protein
MTLFDERFSKNKARYILQCSLAAVSVMAVLVILDAIANAAVIAALGASSFIAFTMPQTRSAQPRFMIGGYLVGVAVGTLCHGLCLLVPAQSPVLQRYVYVLFGSLSVGLAILVMVITNTEHPPAASLALGLVLGEWGVLTVTVVLVGVVLLSLLKRALRPVIRNLL